MFIVAGLGNPDNKYKNTLHNLGFMAVDILADKLGVDFDKKGHKAVYATATVGKEKVIILKPQTYMNHSGEAVREAAAFYKLSPEQIIVISDDASLDVGKQRVKRKGSDGGQKGLRSIIYHMNTDAIPRVKIGVGKKPHPDYDMADWVLGDIPEKEWKTFEESLARSADAVELMLTGNIDRAMNLYNG